MSSQDPNRTLSESAIRKEKYKKLLDEGHRATEDCESSSIIENIEAISNMAIKSNALATEGNISDRVGQTAELVLDAQVG